MTTGDLVIGALLLLLVTAKKAGAATPAKAADAISRIAGLQSRANQEQAQGWIPDFEHAGASEDLAHVLARWTGIESSGDPSKPSKLGERGLLQIMPSTAKTAIGPGDWQSLTDPGTTRAEQARIALKQYHYHRDAAKKYVKDWPGDDTLDAVFYAKLHHQRPKDLSDAKLAGTAAKNSRMLATKWKNDPAALLRLATANVVAWGSINAP